jgi:hypothetical protein
MNSVFYSLAVTKVWKMLGGTCKYGGFGWRINVRSKGNSDILYSQHDEA